MLKLMKSVFVILPGEHGRLSSDLQIPAVASKIPEGWLCVLARQCKLGSSTLTVSLNFEAKFLQVI